MKDLRTLTQRVGQGARGAAEEFRAAYGPHIARIVRRMTEVPSGASAVSRYIGTEIRRAERESEGSLRDDPERVVAVVSGRVCESLIRQARHAACRSPALQETVRW